jgi:hypothetical protein
VRRRLLLWTALCGMLADRTAMATDARVLPPARRSFSAPSGAFTLHIASTDGWASPQAQAELLHTVDGAARRVWQQALPQPLGPRQVLVADSGAVLMLDEWRNSPSPHALLLIAPGGGTLAHISIDSLVATLGVPRKTVASHARFGTWLSSPPQWSPDGSSLRLQAGGQALRLDLASGQLILSK